MGLFTTPSILIVVVPEILIALLAASIVMAGIVAIYIGHVIRKPEIEFQNDFLRKEFPSGIRSIF